MANGHLSFRELSPKKRMDDASRSDGRETGQLHWRFPTSHYDLSHGRPGESAQPPPPLGPARSVHETTRLQRGPPVLLGYAPEVLLPQRSGYLFHGGLRGYEFQVPGSGRPRCAWLSDDLQRYTLNVPQGHFPYIGQPVDVAVNPYGHPQHSIPPLHHLPQPSQVHPLCNHPLTARWISPVEKEAYSAKLQELQQYVPSLVRALNQLSRGRMEDRGRESVRKLQFVLRVLQDKTTRVSLSSLMTYEFTIKKICALHVDQTRGATKRVLEQESMALPDAKHARLSAQVEPKESQSTCSASSPDLLEESLLCGICQDIMHDCVCLQPCLHSYCSGCYSLWMVKSNLCPMCRMRAKRIGKHHMLNSIVESYLLLHPEKRRKADDLNVLDKQNRIIHDMLLEDSADVWSHSSLEEDGTHHRDRDSGDEQTSRP